LVDVSIGSRQRTSKEARLHAGNGVVKSVEIKHIARLTVPLHTAIRAIGVFEVIVIGKPGHE
jgi:hypothetical protein